MSRCAPRVPAPVRLCFHAPSVGGGATDAAVTSTARASTRKRVKQERQDDSHVLCVGGLSRGTSARAPHSRHVHSSFIPLTVVGTAWPEGQSMYPTVGSPSCSSVGRRDSESSSEHLGHHACHAAGAAAADDDDDDPEPAAAPAPPAAAELLASAPAAVDAAPAVEEPAPAPAPARAPCSVVVTIVEQREHCAATSTCAAASVPTPKSDRPGRPMR